MKTIEGKKEIKTFTQICDECGKEITGYSQSVTDWYMSVHKQTQHKKRDKKEVK